MHRLRHLRRFLPHHGASASSFSISRTRLALAFSSAKSAPSPVTGDADVEPPSAEMTPSEARRMVRLVGVEELKSRLQLGDRFGGGKEVMDYNELLTECEAAGVARTRDEAARVVQAMDEAGVVLLFRDKVYLHPEKVVELLRRAVPLVMATDEDPRKEELKKLQKQKAEIDKLAHKHVRRVLWTGLAFLVSQTGLFFRLTFWEFSWDVMEPITFFAATSSIVVGYAYFLITSRDPTYQDFMERLFLSRQRKLMKQRNFNTERYSELVNYCKCKYPRDQSVAPQLTNADKVYHTEANYSDPQRF